MVVQQPMKMAAAEALYETESNAGFSIFTLGNLEGTEATTEVKIPGLLSFLSTGSSSGEVEGLNNLQAEYTRKYGEGWYMPNIPTAYWSFRLMIGLGMLAMLYSAFALWTTRKGATPKSKWFMRASIAIPFLPLFGISFGWLFTELGRQPWVVFGQLTTAEGISTSVEPLSVLFTMVGFTLLYGVLAVIEYGLFTKTIRQGPPETVKDPFDKDDVNPPLTFAY
jgi:cytochrome d ubiquinol oxidase subunit I